MTPDPSSATGSATTDFRPDLARLRTAFDLSGQVALVTGGASGLGRMSAWGLALFGADVAVCDRDGETAERTAALIAEETGRRCEGLAVDVTDPLRVDAVVRHVVDTFGTIDICVNSAGINHRESALRLSADAFRRVLDVNLTGTFICARSAGKVMVDKGSGKMINVASVLAHTGQACQAAYAASKGGIVGLTKVLALEWAHSGVQVNALSPAHVSTPLTDGLPEDLRAEALARIPQHRFADAEEIVPPVVFLASRSSDFLTGASLPFDGGWRAA